MGKLFMAEKGNLAFVLDRDEFVRLSLSKILNRYGFEVEEIADLAELEHRKKEAQSGIVLADTEIEAIEEAASFLEDWADRFIWMTPLVTDELNGRLRRIGIRHVIKKPVEPERLKRLIRRMTARGSSADPSKPRGRQRASKQRG